ncbi:MAG: hypothetical protein WDN75_08190 [Bacteroidota bacterium]
MTSDSQAIVINQAMVKEMRLTDPIGKRITNGGNNLWTVIGVVEDFNFETFKNKIGPLCLTIANSPGIISVKVNSSDMQATLGAIGNLWKEFTPHQPIRYSFLDEKLCTNV